MFNWIRRLFISKQTIERKVVPLKEVLEAALVSYNSVIEQVKRGDALSVVRRKYMNEGLCFYLDLWIPTSEMEATLNALFKLSGLDKSRYISVTPAYGMSENNRPRTIAALRDRVFLIDHLLVQIARSIEARKLVKHEFKLSNYRKTG